MWFLVLFSEVTAKECVKVRCPAFDSENSNIQTVQDCMAIHSRALVFFLYD